MIGSTNGAALHTTSYDCFDDTNVLLPIAGATSTPDEIAAVHVQGVLETSANDSGVAFPRRGQAPHRVPAFR